MSKVASLMLPPIATRRTDFSRVVETHRADAILRRSLDVSIAIAAAILLSPLMIVLALLVWAQDRGPVFYGQMRIGQGGRQFRCWKFRSMVPNSAERLTQLLASDTAARTEWNRDHKLKRDPRITAIGGFLRRSSLDELPQLLNVLVGEMSLVGPRPIVQAEACRYGARFRNYCSVKPGVTGLWQISGRNDTTYRRRVALDTVYVKKQSAFFNLYILVATVPAILFAKGSY